MFALLRRRTALVLKACQAFAKISVNSRSRCDCTLTGVRKIRIVSVPGRIGIALSSVRPGLTESAEFPCASPLPACTCSSSERRLRPALAAPLVAPCKGPQPLQMRPRPSLCPHEADGQARNKTDWCQNS